MIACYKDSRTFQNANISCISLGLSLVCSWYLSEADQLKLYHKASLGKGDGTHLSNISSLSNINLSLTNIRMKLWQTFGLFDVWNLPRSQSSTALWRLRTSRNQKHEDRPRMKHSTHIWRLLCHYIILYIIYYIMYITIYGLYIISFFV